MARLHAPVIVGPGPADSAYNAWEAQWSATPGLRDGDWHAPTVVSRGGIFQLPYSVTDQASFDEWCASVGIGETESVSLFTETWSGSSFASETRGDVRDMDAEDEAIQAREDARDSLIEELFDELPEPEEPELKEPEPEPEPEPRATRDRRGRWRYKGRFVTMARARSLNAAATRRERSR